VGDDVAPAVEEDVAAVAALHGSLLPGSFLSTLGVTFLGLLYRRVLRQPGSLLLVASSDGRVVGFIAGTEDTFGLYRSFLRHDGLPATAATARGVLRHPSAGLRIAETVRYGRTASVPGVELPRAELLSMGVVPEARGKGLASSLVTALQDRWRGAGVFRARVVVSLDNGAAIATYERAGFAPVGRLDVHGDRASQVMVWG
jgi:ribosomal protein S18 acetylase RimI-like enzyme